VLVLDNAAYHHIRGDDYINPNEMDKNEIAFKLIEFGYKELVVTRGSNNKTYRFGQASFYQRGGKWAPTLDELKIELKKYLAAHPEQNRTEIQKMFSERGYQLIYTPPYTPTVQPIELVWAYVKNYVARQYESNRPMELLRNQTLEGFYGNHDLHHQGVTANLCHNMIEHCHKWCNEFIEQDWELEGKIDQLTLNKEEEIENPIISDDLDDDLHPFTGEMEDEQQYD
jgi:transposase